MKSNKKKERDSGRCYFDSIEQYRHFSIACFVIKFSSFKRRFRRIGKRKYRADRSFSVPILLKSVAITR